VPPEHNGDVLLTRRHVLAAIGMRSTWLKAAVKSGAFPAPVRIGNRALFSRREVQAWIEARKAERGAAA
jgi:predicted DNA-binding transcriptional regulator AlpA